ncbi:DNA replication/repair protein RecF [Lysobacter zhanggongensis]|uniref:DNA replication and repair protein RecF n=1 Tax=Lysobacter zhanggongensis TaxID=1774951 RepID=A0ABU7YSL3_9GAMM
MRVTRLDLRNVRRFEEASWRPGPGLNVVTGDNGAGKSTVLEALHLMAYGRSFRGRVRDGLIRTGAPALEVFVEWQQVGSGALHVGGGVTRRAGLRHSGADWSGRIDGAQVSQLGELIAALAVVTFEPGSHALVSGSADTRRRYLDWGLFHVEHEFMPIWRRYSRALKQRNALLKSRGGPAQLDAWDHELATAGEQLSSHREGYLAMLEPAYRQIGRDLVPSLGDVALEYAPGWRRHEVPLADALLLSRVRDQQAGFTSVGPHRADFRLGFSALPGREALSRGQAKLVALSALLAQAQHLASWCGEWPVIALDDLASELDHSHQTRVIERLGASGAQVLVTGTAVPAALASGSSGVARFHVEHGRIAPAEPA